ncbi:MAG TPA: type ISP restriction/modification enzyme, partial [Herpetosiphonaceae bacterium]
VPVLDLDITQPANIQRLLDQFFGYVEPQIDQFHRAVAEFRRQIPGLAQGLTAIIEGEKRDNRRFAQALAGFWDLCKGSLNPNTSIEEVEDMLKQHLLTERIFRSVFGNPDFVRRNAIARELEKVVDALTSRSFSRAAFMAQLDYFYEAIEKTARTIADYSEKQSFLNAVYEQFFQSYSTNTADTHGIVYTPAPIVRWMVASVEQVLQREFGTSLSEPGVNLLDPCVGTGTFMLEIIDKIRPSALPHKYDHELHCNEVLLLPYYIASQNIEHEYYERTGQYAAFEGICFADTLDMGRVQLQMFAPENTERVKRQESAPIFVIIGNPPYNVGQVNENDNNKNRKYPEIDRRIRNTYAKSSQATNKRALSDMYVRFFRWATDRLYGGDGVICFVSNNSFLDQFAFDGMRKELLKDFTSIYTLDLGGNVRQNPKLSGTTHNVFGIQVGVAITLLVRKRNGEMQRQPATVHYARVDEWWRREQKCSYLDQMGDFTGIEWQILTPNARGTWLTAGAADDFDSFVPMGTKEAKEGRAGSTSAIFRTYSRGAETTRDSWMYDFDRNKLASKARTMIETYNSELSRWIRAGSPSNVDDFVLADEAKIKWSSRLKECLVRKMEARFDPDSIRNALYRPFTRQYLYFDNIMTHRQGVFPRIFPLQSSEAENYCICVTDVGSEKPFLVFMSDVIADLHLVGAGSSTQCFPFYTYDEDGSNRRENITDWALEQYRAQYGAHVTKWDIFHGIYGLLHAPEYRAKYAQNLKRDLPRIPFVSPEAWAAFVAAGRELAALHVGYEQAQPYPLKHIEKQPFTWRVEKMRLSADKTELVVNTSLTLAGIPREVYDYRLGNRSALEWVIDQYQLKTDARSGITSDPNHPDDPEYIVRLVKQVVQVSVETARIVAALPGLG